MRIAKTGLYLDRGLNIGSFWSKFAQIGATKAKWTNFANYVHIGSLRELFCPNLSTFVNAERWTRCSTPRFKYTCLGDSHKFIMPWQVFRKQFLGKT
jgi:hypothetical protein